MSEKADVEAPWLRSTFQGSYGKFLERICEADPKGDDLGRRIEGNPTNLVVQRKTIELYLIHFCEGAPTPKLINGPVTLCGCCRP